MKTQIKMSDTSSDSQTRAEGSVGSESDRPPTSLVRCRATCSVDCKKKALVGKIKKTDRQTLRARLGTGQPSWTRPQAVVAG